MSVRFSRGFRRPAKWRNVRQHSRMKYFWHVSVVYFFYYLYIYIRRRLCFNEKEKKIPAVLKNNKKKKWKQINIGGDDDDSSTDWKTSGWNYLCWSIKGNLIALVIAIPFLFSRTKIYDDRFFCLAGAFLISKRNQTIPFIKLLLVVMNPVINGSQLDGHASSCLKANVLHAIYKKRAPNRFCD